MLFDHGLMSEAELADILRVSARTVRRLVDDGQLRRVRVGCSPAFSISDLSVFLKVKPGYGREDAVPERLMTPDDVVRAYAGLSPACVRRMAAAGEIPALRIGRNWRFSPSGLDAWFSRPATEVGSGVTPAAPPNGTNDLTTALSAQRVVAEFTGLVAGPSAAHSAPAP